MRQAKGPQFTRFFGPVLEVLKETGGSGTVAEVIDRVIDVVSLILPFISGSTQFIEKLRH